MKQLKNLVLLQIKLYVISSLTRELARCLLITTSYIKEYHERRPNCLYQTSSGILVF